MKYRHYFSDHQHCFKCGKGEWMPVEDDCTMSDEEFEDYRRKGLKPEWTYINGPIRIIYTKNGPISVSN